MGRRNLKDQKAAAHEGRIRRITRPAGMTASQADEAKAGARIGRIVRERQEASEALALAQSVSDATGRPIDFSLSYGDKLPPNVAAELGHDRRTLADARAMIDAAEEAARKFQRSVGRYRSRDDERMTDKDVWNIAGAAASATAAAINRKVSRSARLSEDEYADLRGWLIAEIARLDSLRRMPARGRPTAVLAWIDRMSRSALLPTLARLEDAPRWRSILKADEATDAAGTLRGIDPDSLRGRWIGWLILRGKEWRQERADRMAQAVALWDVGENSDERQAARIADRIAAESADASATIQAVNQRLIGGGSEPLGKAETLALELALTGLSRRELAARHGHSADYVKTATKRGRANIADRWETARAMRREIDAASEAAIGTRHGRPADVLAWIDANPEARERLASEWRTLSVKRASGKLPARPRKSRRAIVATLRATFPVARHGRPADVLAWIDRASRCEPRPLRVGYSPAPLAVVATPAAPRGGSLIVTAWGPQKAANATRPNAGPIVTGTARETAEGRRMAQRTTWTEPDCDCAACKPRKRASKRASGQAVPTP
jgi:hypothetical protein